MRHDQLANCSALVVCSRLRLRQETIAAKKALGLHNETSHHFKDIMDRACLSVFPAYFVVICGCVLSSGAPEEFREEIQDIENYPYEHRCHLAQVIKYLDTARLGSVDGTIYRAFCSVLSGSLSVHDAV